MKKKILDGKFTVEIKDGYLEGSNYNRANGTAVIKLFAEEPSVSLKDLADAIICCTFTLYEPIDSNKFYRLNIYLEINKGLGTTVTYNFEIPNHQADCDVLPELAQNIRL